MSSKNRAAVGGAGMVLRLLVALAVKGCAKADVYVTDKTFETTIAEYRTAAATFGQPFPENGIAGRAVVVDPPDGCRAIQPPPDPSPNSSASFVAIRTFDEFDVFGLEGGQGQKGGGSGRLTYEAASASSDPSATKWVAMIARYGGCNFEVKVRNAMRANYSAVIVYNVNSNKLVPMAGSDDSLIPSVFMGGDDAQVLRQKYTYEQAPELRIVVTDDHPFDINAYLLPFAIVVGICFVIMLIIVIYKCVQDYRRSRRHRLPKSALRKLPIHKFKNGDPFETCCICLDDFEEGDKLRILPCDHGYHAKCIDPWLVKTKRICPQCRKRVFESNERGAGLISVSSEEARSDSDSDFGSPRPSTSTGGGRNGGGMGAAAAAVAASAAAAAAAAARQSLPDEREPLLPSRRSHTSRFTQRERRNFRRQRRSMAGSSAPSGGGASTTGQVVRNSGTFPAVSAGDAGSGGAMAFPPPERGTEHPAGSSQRLSTQERIRRAFGRGGSSHQQQHQAVIQQQEIISSNEEFADESFSSEDDDDVAHEVTVTSPVPSTMTSSTTTRVVTTNQDAVTVRIEQPLTSSPSGGRSRHQLVAEVHVVPKNNYRGEAVIVADELMSTTSASANGNGSAAAANSPIVTTTATVHYDQPRQGAAGGRRGGGGDAPAPAADCDVVVIHGSSDDEAGAEQVGGAVGGPSAETTSLSSMSSQRSSASSKKKSKRNVENV